MRHRLFVERFATRKTLQLRLGSAKVRKGSPQTLVCTKTRHSYEQKCAAYREDIAALGVLADLVGRPPKALAGQVKRIAAALERAATANTR
jgi:hypothetical protein